MIVPARKTYKVTTEKNVHMKTRDGITLFADVIRPYAPGRFPVLLSRTPYNKKGTDDPNGASYLFARYGYVTVMQDCRGRFESEGEYDTIFQEIAEIRGYTKTILGRRIRFRKRYADGRLMDTNKALNSSVQGSAADIFKLAMIDVDHRDSVLRFIARAGRARRPRA